MKPKFYRKEALEKLSTPEKLDQLITITNPRSWIALISLFLIIITGIAWSFYGTTKMRVQGVGIIMRGEVYNIVSNTSGQVLELKIGLNDFVHPGQVVAVVTQPDIVQNIQGAEADLEEKRFQLVQLKQFGSEDSRIQQQLVKEQKSGFEDKITTNKSQIEFYKSHLTTEENLLTQGLITKTQVEQTRQHIVGLQNEIKILQSKITQTTSQQLNLDHSHKQKITTLEQQIAQESRRITQFMDDLDLHSNITSQYSGKIMEVMTEKGLVLSPGTPLFKLSTDGSGSDKLDLRAILFVPSKDGKKVKEGMEALIAPSTVKPQEFGYMKGIVDYISDFPATPQGIANVLKNDQLAEQMLSLGAPFEVHIIFEKNIDMVDSYKWTSGKGSPLEIYPGTPCSGRVTVEVQKPIAVMLPAFKKFFELY